MQVRTFSVWALVLGSATMAAERRVVDFSTDAVGSAPASFTFANTAGNGAPGRWEAVPAGENVQGLVTPFDFVPGRVSIDARGRTTLQEGGELGDGRTIAAFKVRQGMPIGCRVTLRGDRMWEFLDRLITVALPRVRDFRGVPSKSFDGRGNYTLGVRDHLIFPEVDYNKVERTKGMNITIVTTAGNDERALYLLRELGMPFAR